VHGRVNSLVAGPRYSRGEAKLPPRSG
jgi:hypothetical protein